MSHELNDDSSTTDDHDAQPPMKAFRYPDGSITYPEHPTGPNGGASVEVIDLSEYTATVLTWTVSTATPSGVRRPNPVAIVEFDIDGESVRAIGQLATAGDFDDGSGTDEEMSVDVVIGDEVRPVYVDSLRDSASGIRAAESQEWDGYRFDPI
ncbi:hypothetical protein G3I44_15875 [Halogeometricum borinquense]|uniref:Nucleic acid-binding protein n=1 Tax=Halogeometricum borinquense TaxID=60847 RepID=A0A6C0UJD5_9EURY|nr:hypothetical protein [Halogeometricum borinquense]QIB75636.1 hypothetical protein G3I44_15875 [Halogeometricum borinquense]